MNVWIVNPFDSMPTEGSRPQRYWMMAEAFVRAGHRVTLWTSDFSHATKRRRVHAAGVPAPPFEVVEIATRPYATNVCWARVRSHRRLARDFVRLAAARPAPDLVIASAPPLGLCTAALRVARSRSARFVCDIQDAWPETFVRLLPRGLRWTGRVLFAPLYAAARRLYREADLVTGVSARYAQLTGRDDFFLAYLGIAASPCAREATRTTDHARAVARLAYVGNLGRGYDLETVIAAVAQREGLSLDIAGAGPQEMALKALVERRGLAERVRFHGQLAAARLEALLATCEVGVIPMRDDSWVGLPNKLGDYLKAGLPVVSSLGGECDALLRTTGFGAHYEAGSSASFLKALDALPETAASLPDALRAECIYPRYVTFVEGV